MIYELFVFNRMLSDEEIAIMHRHYKCRYVTGAYFPLDEQHVRLTAAVLRERVRVASETPCPSWP